jgi:N12 class adenine-specific DNA methylase/SAM-dependent methyltransferase
VNTNPTKDDQHETAVPRGLRAVAALRALKSTEPDRDALLGWPGWGALAPAFGASPKGSWLTIADDIDELVSASDLTVARDYIDTSFYTPPRLVESIFHLLAETGFTGGRVLEPGCGSGRFMAGTPSNLNIDWTGVEVDPTSAAMAAALNPNAKIINSSLQNVSFVTGEFDAVIGNVPFSSTTVYDHNFPSASLHEYFIIRALDAVREGGYVIAITSRFTMDSETGLYKILDATTGGELMAAVRLPSGAFASEGTQVVTDILLFRKRVTGDNRRGWNDAVENASVANQPYYPYSPVSNRPVIDSAVDPDKPHYSAKVNRYWVKNPEHVAGTMMSSSFYQNPLVVVSSDRDGDTLRAVQAAATHLVPQTERHTFNALVELADVKLFDPDGRLEGSFHLVDDVIHEVSSGSLTPVRNSAELRSLIVLRDHADALLALESNIDLPDFAITETRAATLAAYEAYVQKFGALNRGIHREGKIDEETGEPTPIWARPSLGGFRRDPSYINVMALEQFNQDDGEAAPAPILLRRVNHAPIPVTSVNTPAEALAVSMGEGRGVDLTRIASLLDLASDDAALEVLGDLAFRDGGRIVDARTYLSGNVRAKLEAAIVNAAISPAYERNVAALEAVVPADLGPLDIRVALGAPYVTTDDVSEFAREILGGSARVEYTASVGVWEVAGSRNAYSSQSANLTYGTGRITPMQILEHALNGKSITIYDESWEFGRTVRVRNIPESIAAEEKLRSLDDRFSTWVWEDHARSVRIQTEYNLRFNSHVTRKADGSYLTFDGLAEGVTPWAHQKNAVDRIISSERALIGHPVGSGKTLSMLLTVLSLRRFGLAQKPLITVPNHLLEQIVREAQQAYPTAKFLIASKEDLTKERRRLFAARCATGEWDAVVMTHSAFTSLPVSPDVELDWIEDQKAELRAAMSTVGNDNRSKGAKKIASAVRSLESRLGQLRHTSVRDNDQVLFDHLGIDYIAVDEGHLFRRLNNGSTSRDNGFGSGSSKRATDMLLKIETLAQKYPGKPIVSMFTGTPWANTLAETWTWQRYLQPDALSNAGVKSFDAWVATFVKYENAVEVSPDGSGFRMNKRPVGMKNLPELMTMLSQVADIISAESLGLPRPSSTEHNIVSEPTPQQFEYVKNLAERADATRGSRKALRPDGQGEDNMLLICNDGRKVALDPQLVGIDEQSAKVADAAHIIAGIFHQTKGNIYGTSVTPGAAQLALLDLGTPRPGDNQVYGRLRGMLVELGVPFDMVRFIHEAKTDKARAAMFAQAREGAIAVLLGSTSKVGIGTNIQTRLIALHHIDAPWTPAEVTQREGRALRPGNLNVHVDIYRYVTANSFDAYTWSALERKARAFAKLYAADSTDREIDDISSVSLSYGEVKALAAGNPLLLDQAKVNSEVSKLRLMRSVHLQGVNRARQRASEARQSVTLLRAENVQLAAAIKIVELQSGDDERDLSGIATLALMISTKNTTARHQVGDWHGLGLRISSRNGSDRRGLIISMVEGYREVGSFEVSAMTQRRGEEEIAKAILGALNTWQLGLPRSVANNLATIDRLTAAAIEGEATVDAAVFEHEIELEFAISRQVEIDAAINEAANAPVPVAA